MTTKDKRDALEALDELESDCKTFIGRSRVFETIRLALTDNTPRWSTIDSFPVKYDEFLFYDGKTVRQGFMEWDKYDGYYWTSMTGDEIKPTHWMPLPAAPQEEK